MRNEKWKGLETMGKKPPAGGGGQEESAHLLVQDRKRM
jgi:hypothetical protein